MWTGGHGHGQPNCLLSPRRHRRANATGHDRIPGRGMMSVVPNDVSAGRLSWSQRVHSRLREGWDTLEMPVVVPQEVGITWGYNGLVDWRGYPQGPPSV